MHIEAAVVGCVAWAAWVVVLAVLGDAAGVAMHPWVLAGAVAAFVIVRRLIPVGLARLQSAPAIVILVLFFAYVCWLAWPSLMPLGEGPDIVHHLTLIHFIQFHHALPHDPLLGAYLGEMNTYTPGSHVLAAMLADGVRADGVHVVIPLVALFVALKAAIVYFVLLRLFRGSETAAPTALAGALMLLIPHAYLLQSFTRYGFYSQVIAETFAVAMVWSAVAWYESPSYRIAIVCCLAGIGATLCWPVFMPAPALAFLVAALGTRSLRTSDRFYQVLVAIGPIALTAFAFAATHRGSSGILSSGGSVLTPSVGAFGWVFLALTAVGVGIAVPRGGTCLPVLGFTAACVAQIGALFALQAYLGASNFYLPFKSVHLLTYAMVMLAAVPIDTIARALPRPGLSWLAPLLVVVWISRTDLPRRPISSPLTEPAYRAGRWAATHVPPQCVDYLVDHWLTGYWLHIDVLGNPRASERMKTELFDERTVVGRWIEGRGLPFAIVGDLESLPRDALPTFRVLQRFGRTAVVQRADGGGRCTDHTPTIDQVGRTSGPSRVKQY